MPQISPMSWFTLLLYMLLMLMMNKSNLPIPSKMFTTVKVVKPKMKKGKW